MNRLRPYFAFLTVIGIVLVVLIGFFTVSSGRRVSGVFSSINSGLSPAGAGLPAQAGDAGSALTSAGGAQANTGSEQPHAEAANDGQRLVIKTADLSMTVENIAQAEASMRTMASRLGGYVLTFETHGTGSTQTASLAFRVPDERFDEALSGVQGVAHEVLQRSIGGDDVTEAYVDLEARLHNLEITRDRLLVFLEKTGSVADALRVNESLSQVQGEIEQTRGQMQYMTRSAALATIKVVFSTIPLPPVEPLVTPPSWQPLMVASDSFRGVLAVSQALANMLIVVLVWTPLWLPFSLAVWWSRRWWWASTR